jgi:aquaporin Z
MGPRAWAAEAAGTALLMFGGLAAIAVASPAGPLLVGALFGGCVTLVAVSPLGRVSGAHLNPAVTLAYRVLGRMSSRDVCGYVAAQLAGAALGSLAARAVWGAVDGAVTHIAVSTPAAIALEAAMTAVLVLTVFWFGSRERLAPWTPAAIPVVLAVLVALGGAATGASLNPARSAGPALAFGDLGGLWLYLVAPVLGALALALAWCAAPRLREPMVHPSAMPLR